MRFYCVHHGDAFGRLAHALAASIRANVPRAVAQIDAIDEPEPVDDLPLHYTANQQKLKLWRDKVHEADGPLILIDADCMVRLDPFEAFEQFGEFDIAYTTRPGRLPVNSGVVFVRPNARSAAFFDEWVRRDDALIADRVQLGEQRSKFGGANQASFVELVLSGETDTKLRGIPCRHWNSVDETWKDFEPDRTRIVHIKGKLRDACLFQSCSSATLRPLVTEWLQYAGEGVAVG